MRLIDPESVAFGSVDDDGAEAIARSMGWSGGHVEHGSQDYVRLPEFGPRKIHSTPEVEPDPLLEDAHHYQHLPDAGALTPQYVSMSVSINGVLYTLKPGGTVDLPNGQRASFAVDPASRFTFSISQGPAPVDLTLGGISWTQMVIDECPPTPQPRRTPTYKAKFYERRPTERPKVGRPRRRR